MTSKTSLSQQTDSAAWAAPSTAEVQKSLVLSAIRISQRHLVPQFIIALYYSLRHKCMVSPQAKVQLSRKISFGKGTVVKAFALVQAHNGKVQFGKRCAISSFSYINGGDADLIVGDYVRMGPHVTILGSSRVYDRTDIPVVDQGFADKGVTIGDDVLIGAGATLLDGCNIGKGTIIVAGSVVSRDTPPYSIVAGIPARVIGKRGQ